MKILAVSDLHYDQWLPGGHDPIGPLVNDLSDLDALLILGDLSNDPEAGWPTAFGHLREVIDPAKIWLLPGNHDYYGFRLDGDGRLREIAEKSGVNFVQKTTFELGGVRFLACTLWSDFRLRGNAQHVLDLVSATRFKDYQCIRRSAAGPLARPADTIAVFEDHLEWLTGALGAPHAGRTVVLTHHVPSRSLSGRLDDASPAYGSDLDALIHLSGPDIWLCGHTHRRIDAVVGGTRLRNVSLGYPWEVRAADHRQILMAGLMDTELPGLLVSE
ncbi:metallophosphoesterase [Paracoccus sp. ME4]|uniref:metallophosphoesterase n=1 Tax=Paracoccus sp. ME4 TaxID=3138066 RepID=UPI00398A56C7